MDLIERYVEAVTARLRPKRRGEVERELRASILDALEARGGSPDSETDVAAVLAELGEPSVVAAGYEPGSQYLIGPELYPLFRRVVRVTLATLVGASAVAFAVALLLGGLAEFRAGELLEDTLEFAIGAAVVAVVVIVGVFAWLQRSEVSVPARKPARGALGSAFAACGERTRTGVALRLRRGPRRDRDRAGHPGRDRSWRLGGAGRRSGRTAAAHPACRDTERDAPPGGRGAVGARPRDRSHPGSLAGLHAGMRAWRRMRSPCSSSSAFPSSSSSTARRSWSPICRATSCCRSS